MREKWVPPIILKYIRVVDDGSGRVAGTGTGTREEIEATPVREGQKHVIVSQLPAIAPDVEWFYRDGELVSNEVLPPPETYIDRRKREYPSIGDQLDALWKGGQAAEDMKKKVQKVKRSYPKGT